MDKLVKWLEDLIRAQKKSRAWRTFVSCLAAIVVFTTTYSLILPAITVESTATEDVGGLVMEGTDAGSTGAQAEASGEVVTVNAENEIPEEPVQEEAPAQETAPAEETSVEETAAEETPTSSSENGTAQPAASQPQTVQTAESTAAAEEVREPVNGEVQTIGDKRVMTLKGDDFDVVVSGDLSVGVSDRTVLSVRGIADPEVAKSFSDRIADELLKIFVDTKTTEVLYQLVFTDENLVEYTPAGYFDVQFIFHRNTVSHTGEKIYAAIYDYLTDEMVLAEKNGDEYETPVISLDEYGIIKGITLKGMHFDEYSDIITLVAGPVNEELKLAAEKAAEAAASESKAENTESADSKTEKTESADGTEKADSADKTESTDAKADSAESKAEGPSAKTETSKGSETAEGGALTARGTDYTVTLTYGADAKIPAGASLEVSEIESGTRAYKKYLAQAKAAMGLDKDQELPKEQARFFDIKIMADGKEVQPSANVSVNITYDQPVVEAVPNAEAQVDASAVHFGKEGAEVVTVNDVDASRVEFEAESFSVYGVIYTVDFEYTDPTTGGTYYYSLNGGESINLTELLVLLGIKSEDEVEKFVAEEIRNVEFSNPELVKVTHDGKFLGLFGKEDWKLESLQPFDTEETLTISLKNGEVIEVKVTDATTYTNLAEYITDARLTVDGKTYGKGETWTVRPDVNYDLKLFFSEAGQRQFPMGGDEMVMDLVPGMTLRPGTSGTFNIPFGAAGTLSGNSWFVGSDNKLHIVFAEDPDDLLTRSSQTRFEVDLFASFDGSQNKINFNDRVNRDIELNNDTDASIEKKGTYNPDTGKMEYTLTVTAEGKAKDVKVTDIISGNMLTLDQNSITLEPQKTLKGNINTNSKGFDLTISEMSHNEVVTIKYEASVDFSKVGPGGKVSGVDGKNTVKVETNNKEHEDEEIINTIKFSDVSKTSTTQDDKGETVEMGWKIEANKGMRGSIKGSKITDKIDYNNRDNMHYLVGENGKLALTVTKTDANNQSTTETVYVDVTKDYDGAPESWTWIPQDDGVYSYVISYKTEVTKQSSALTVKNDVTNESDDSDSGTGVVPGTGPGGPGSDSVTATKAAVEVTPEYIDWDIVVVIPAEGYPDGFVIVDEIPNGADLGRKFADTFDRIISVSGLHDNESYDNPPQVTHEAHNNLTPKTKDIVTINFYQDQAKKDPGLDGGAQRTVTVRIRTLNDPDWVNFADTANGGEQAIYHTNKAKVNNSEWFTDKAAPMHTSIKKEHRDLAADNVGGVNLGKYEYSLTLTNVTKLPLVITDTFDENELVFIGPGDAYSGHATIAAAEQKNNLNNGTPGYSATYDDSKPGELTITVDNLPTKQDGSFYEFYRIYYTMRVKDADALAAIKEQALLNGGSYNVKNSVEWNGVGDEHNIEFKVPVLEKEGAFLGDLGTSKEREYGFTIKFNKDRSELNGGEPLELSDTHSENLSVDYHSVKVYKLPAGVDTISEQYLDNTAKWNFDGNNGTFTLDDNTYYVITYEALVIGSGSQAIWNEASIDGFSATKTDSRDFGGSASGEGKICQVKLIKHQDGQTSEGLGGATFQLFKDDGNGGKEPMKWGKDNSLGNAGENITFTTDDTGYVLIALNQSQHGNELEEGVHYYLKEIETPPGYKLRADSPEYWEFTLTSDPDEVNYGDPDRRDANGRRQWIYYYYDDVLKMANVPAEEPITLNVDKLWFDETGKPIKDEELEDLRAEVRLQRKINNGEYENVKVTYDDEGTPTVEAATGTEGIVELNKDNDWKWSWPDLPRVVPGGDKYAYKIEEVAVEGYVVSVTENETETTKTYSLKNYKKPPEDQTTNIQVKKVWQNESGTAVQAPNGSKIKFHLYQVMSKVPFEVQPTSGGVLYDVDGKEANKVPASDWEEPSETGVGYYQIDATDSWMLSFSGLPSAKVDPVSKAVTYYAYYVKEDPINSYTTSYSTEVSDDGIVKQITNMPEGSYMNLNLEKKWKKGEEFITPPSGASATFEIHRMKSTCTVLPMQHRVTIKWGENQLVADVGDEIAVYIKGSSWGTNIKINSSYVGQIQGSSATYSYTVNTNYGDVVEFSVTEPGYTITNIIDKTERQKQMSEAVDDGVVKVVTLSDSNSWTEYIKDLIRVDEHGNVYSYYVTETVCTPEPIAVVYTDDIGKDAGHAVGGDADIEVTNTVAQLKGSLKFKKEVEVGGVPLAGSSDPKKTLATGEFTFTITGPGTGTTVNKTVKIKVVNGIATQYSLDEGPFTNFNQLDDEYVVIPDLDEGDYTITETVTGNMVLKDITRGDGDIDAVSKADSKVVVHVTGGDEAPADASAAAAIFTNNRELTDFEVTKEWRNQSDEPVQSWDEGVAIKVKVQRKISESSEEIGTYTITKTSDGFNITSSDNAPALENTAGTFTFKIEKLPKNGTIGSNSGAYTYYAIETVAVENYKEPTYSNPSSDNSGAWVTSDEYALNGGKIINKPIESYELPSTGGIGTRFYYSLGIAFIAMAGIILFIKRKEMRSLRGEVVIPGDED